MVVDSLEGIVVNSYDKGVWVKPCLISIIVGWCDTDKVR